MDPEETSTKGAQVSRPRSLSSSVSSWRYWLPPFSVLRKALFDPRNQQLIKLLPHSAPPAPSAERYWPLENGCIQWFSGRRETDGSTSWAVPTATLRSRRSPHDTPVAVRSAIKSWPPTLMWWVACGTETKKNIYTSTAVTTAERFLNPGARQLHGLIPVR